MSNWKKHLVNGIWTMAEIIVATLASLGVVKLIDHVKDTDIKDWMRKKKENHKRKGFIRQ